MTRITEKKTGRFMALLLCVLMIVGIITAAWCLAHCAHHDCSGEKCRVCEVARRCGELLRGVGMGLTSITKTILCLSAPAAISAELAAPFTLTAQRVRMND